MANFTPQEIEQFLQEFFDVVGTRQYTGARYVPIFGRKNESTIEWDNLAPYEPLTVVMHNGVSYVSKQYVPTSIAITDTNYWAETYRFNAQVEQYRQEVLGFQEEIDDKVPFPDGIAYPKYGVSGQVLTTLSDGTTKWENPVIPSDEQAEEVITAWLDAHPEATTTVQDNSITTAKLRDGAVTDEKLAQTGGVLSTVENLAGMLDIVNNIITVSERILPNWEQGNINISTGNIAGSATKIRTRDAISVPTGGILDMTFSNGSYSIDLNFRVHLYNAQGVYQSYTYFYKKTTGTVVIPEGWSFKIVIEDPDNVVTISPSDGNALLIANLLTYRNLETDKTLSIENRPADAKAVGDIIGQRYTIVTVRQDGYGDFTNLRGAVESISDASKNNQYIIEIYPGIYDVMGDYTSAEINEYANHNIKFGGIIITDGINLRGMGNNPNDVVLNGYLPTTYDAQTIRNKVATLTIGGNSFIENLTLIAENIRYCVHDAYEQNVGVYTRTVKNVIMRAKSLTSGNPPRTWGCGFMSGGENSYFENVDFGTDLVIHSNTVVTESTLTVFKNCKGARLFFDPYGDTTNNHMVIFDSCAFESIKLDEVNTSNPQNVFFYGTNKKDALISMLEGRVCELESITTFSPVGQINVTAMCTFNNLVIKRTPNKNLAYGVIVCKDSDKYYVSTSKYINAQYIGLTNLNEGDYITVDNLSMLTKTDATAENAVGIVVMYRTEAYIKMFI